MTDRIVSLLRSSGVEAWELSDVLTKGWEFYFIRHELDQNRAKNLENIHLKVYKKSDDGESLGSAEAEVPPTASEKEIKALIDSLAYRATLVKNRPYTLALPRESKPVTVEKPDIASISTDFLQTMKSLPETSGEYINSYEIIVSSKVRRFMSSTGIDVTEIYPESMLEVVVNARKDNHEIELYRNYQCGSCNAENLRLDLLRTMQYGRDRLLAVPTPPLGEADVLFSTSDACELYGYFTDRLDTAMVYRKMSNWKPGEPVCETFLGDRLSLRACRTLPNSSRNHSFDAEGAPVRDVSLIEDGIVKQYLGNRMFSAYLGLEDTFIPTNFSVSGGSYHETELRAGSYLEIVDFSDFQVDSITGDLFGEIRLGYWHNGNSVFTVSGGSVSGSMLDLSGRMFLSRETVQYNNWCIPSATLLKGVTVTGIGSNQE